MSVPQLVTSTIEILVSNTLVPIATSLSGPVSAGISAASAEAEPPNVKQLVDPMVTFPLPIEDEPIVIVSPVSSISVTVIHTVMAPASSFAPEPEPKSPSPSARSPASHGVG